MSDIKLTQDSKVILLFPDLTKFPPVKNIGGYLEEMHKTFGTERIIGDGYYSNEYTQLGEVKVIVYAIISGLTYTLERDNLFYTLKDNTIYIDRLERN